MASQICYSICRASQDFLEGTLEIQRNADLYLTLIVLGLGNYLRHGSIKITQKIHLDANLEYLCKL